VSCFGSERVQLVSLTLHVSFHGYPIPRGKTLESRSNGQTSPLRADQRRVRREIRAYRDTSKRGDQILCRSRYVAETGVMREARGLPGPPARALSDDPRL
jgi:hypothetical protein